ncbi:small acid-soluble spore protein K [Gottfriedia solisilvae]|uniref:Small, acid-soluble spore protein K n=1 Tax=Gottfriedia solisilvae TaxID=1516104 RepID=A0A8J3ANL6_9BACI|nr:small acid-soluble spore protein K [Gottfriedia solisilvae]GGI17153.1 small, acid-soluble spore protein K [Gottfriedia solisilvae]
MTTKSERFSKQKHDMKIDGGIDYKSKNASIRPNGTINTNPQERMVKSNQE